jgi:hypothetical protein
LLSAAVTFVPWLPVRQLLDAFADIRGVGVAKMTRALYPKRPALIPMPGSMVQTYLREDDLGAQAPFAERALGLVRGYRRDLDRNRAAVRAVRQELARCGYGLTEVRILDLLIWSAQAAALTGSPRTPWRSSLTTAVSERTIHDLCLQYRRLCMPMSGRRHLCLPARNRAMA